MHAVAAPDPDGFDAALRLIQTDCVRAVSLLILPSIKKAIDNGVIVVRSSKIGSGYIAEDSAYIGLLGDNLNSQNARIF